jgi:hypothetical protein
LRRWRLFEVTRALIAERVDTALFYFYYLWILTALAPFALVISAVLRPSKFRDVTAFIGWLYYALYFGVIEVLLTGRDLDDVYKTAKNRGGRP